MGRYNLSQFDLSKKAERYINEPEDLKRGRVPFDSGAPRFKNNIPEVDEEYEEEVKGNQVKKIFDQLPTFKAITDGKQNEVEVKSKNKNKKSFGNKVGSFSISHGLQALRRMMCLVLGLITNKTSLNGTSRLSTATTTNIIRRNPLIINYNQ